MFRKFSKKEAPKSGKAITPAIDPADVEAEAERRHVREANKRYRSIFEDAGLEYGPDVGAEELPKRHHKATMLRRSVISKVLHNVRLAHHVDLCFLLDITGSMTPYIEEIRVSIQTIVDILRAAGTGSVEKLRLAVVGYRDFDDEKHFEVMKFTESLSKFRSFCANLDPEGGADVPEDVLGGLEKTLQLNWSDNKNTKLIFHIADAPCHGRKFHDFLDRYDHYISGDPKERSEVDLFKKLAEKKIDYYFGRITARTDKMVKVFSDAYGKEILKFNLKDVAKLTHSVIAATSSSIMSSLDKSKIPEKLEPRKERIYPLVKEVPVWAEIDVYGGYFITYEFPKSIQDVINDEPLIRREAKRGHIQIAPHPFDKGAERYAFYGRDRDVEPPMDLVFKEYILEGSKVEPSACYEAMNQLQCIAAFFANEFGEAAKLTRDEAESFVKLDFLKVKTVGINYNGRTRFLSSEKKFEGKWIRFSNNAGYELLEDHGVEDRFIRTLAAFSHWTYQVTLGNIMVVDLQGVIQKLPGGKSLILLTDPAIHCVDETRFGQMNLGKGGMVSFFRNHQCNEFCEALDLNEVEVDMDAHGEWVILP